MIEFVHGKPRYIVNFPTKSQWRDTSHLQDIRSGLESLQERGATLDDGDFHALGKKFPITEMYKRGWLKGIVESGTVNEDFLEQVVKLSYFDDGPKLAAEFLRKSGIRLIDESGWSPTQAKKSKENQKSKKFS